MQIQTARELFLSLVTIGPVRSGEEHAAYAAILSDWEYTPDIGWIYEIPGNHHTLFTAHADMIPAGVDGPYKLVFEKDIVRGSGHNIGADDRAGMAMLLVMKRAAVPGRYAIFESEECRRLGSMAYSANPTNLKELTHCISFDRKEDLSIVTHQKQQQLCSNICACSIRDKLKANGIKLELDDKGVGTDSYSIWSFNNSIECTNISIGYANAHKANEYQDLAYLDRLASAVIAIDWSNLPSAYPD